MGHAVPLPGPVGDQAAVLRGGGKYACVWLGPQSLVCSSGIAPLWTRCSTSAPEPYLSGVRRSYSADLVADAVRMKDLTGVTDVNVSPLYFCGLLKRHNKVALTGEYTDEIFPTMM